MRMSNPFRRYITMAIFVIAAACSPAQTNVQLDRIAALVNNTPILESDVQQELEVSRLVPTRADAAENTPEKKRTAAVDRLIDRMLITDQEQWQPPKPVTDTELADDIKELQRRIPDCSPHKCDTVAGWSAVLAAHGFTTSEFNTRWKARIEMLRFIELRFRDGARITPGDVRDYYRDTLTPQYAAAHTTPPPLPQIENRIQQLLLEERISSLLEDWLKQLRTAGNVRILAPGEDLP